MGEIGADCVLLFFGFLQTRGRCPKSLSFSVLELLGFETQGHFQFPSPELWYWKVSRYFGTVCPHVSDESKDPKERALLEWAGPG